MKRVALLRGINVGGRTSLPIAQLREIAQGLGLAKVSTYIQGGNLLFEGGGSPEAVEAALAAAIELGAANPFDHLAGAAAMLAGCAIDLAAPAADAAEILARAGSARRGFVARPGGLFDAHRSSPAVEYRNRPMAVRNAEARLAPPPYRTRAS